MKSMFFANMLNPGVVFQQGEPDRMPIVFPKPGDELALVIPMFVETLFKEFIGNEFSVWKSIHAEYDLDVDAVVGCKYVAELVFDDDLFRDVMDAHADVFRSGKR